MNERRSARPRNVQTKYPPDLVDKYVFFDDGRYTHQVRVGEWTLIFSGTYSVPDDRHLILNIAAIDSPADANLTKPQLPTKSNLDYSRTGNKLVVRLNRVTADERFPDYVITDLTCENCFPSD